jgi:inhibitor of cysteine peptidase
MCKFIIFILLLLIVKCTPEQEMLILTNENNGQPIKLTLHQEFQIELVSNPTTGFNWTLVDTTTNSIHLVQSQFQLAADQNIVGAPGKQLFYLQANAVGQTEVKLIYQRPWEKDVAPVDSFCVVIDVKD